MTTSPNVKFFIASVTTQGALSKDFKKLLKYLVNAYPENMRKYKLQQIIQRLSSQIHDITSDNLNYALEHMGTVNQINFPTNHSQTSQNNSNFYTLPPSTRQFQSSSSSSSSSSSTSSSSSHILPI